MGQIELKGIRKSFAGVEVIKGIDLQINEGELVIFVGPSGCGKSTLLRLISGLVEASDGQILIDGDDVTGKPPAERELSMVFQSYALYPHKSVRENMGFALTVAGMPKAEITQKVDEAAATLKLEDYLDRKPKALSGGQRQRVAIGRAIVREPRAFLFDEPLSNLDAALRVEMRLEIARLHQKLGATMVYVTHDQVEAMTLADKIVVLQAGQIEQIGTPLDLYRHPGNLFVAQFIGSPKMNVVDCTGTGTQLTFGNGNTSDIARNAEGATKMGIRPEHMALCAPNGAANGGDHAHAVAGDAVGNAAGNVAGNAVGDAGLPANNPASNASAASNASDTSNASAASDANPASDALGTPAPGKAILTGQIDVMEHLGSDSFAYVNVPDVGLFTVRIVGHSDAVEGDMVGLHFASGDVHLFDASEKTIPA